MKSNWGRPLQRVAATLGAMVVLVLALANGAEAQVGPETPASPAITFSTSIACSGSTLGITISGLKPGSLVQVFIHREVVAPPPPNLTGSPSLGGCASGVGVQAVSAHSAGAADVHAAAGGTFNTSGAELIASGYADAGGTFNTTAVIPADILPGYHQITADVTDAQGAARTLSGQILVLPRVPVSVLANQVSGKQAVPAGGHLASTGSNSIIPLAGGAGLLVLAGAALVLATRRRRARATA